MANRNLAVVCDWDFGSGMFPAYVDGNEQRRVSALSFDVPEPTPVQRRLVSMHLQLGREIEHALVSRDYERLRGIVVGATGSLCDYSLGGNNG